MVYNRYRLAVKFIVAESERSHLVFSGEIEQFVLQTLVLSRAEIQLASVVVALVEISVQLHSETGDLLGLLLDFLVGSTERRRG